MCCKTHRLGNECLCSKNRHRFLETGGIAYPAGLGGGHMEKLQNWSVGRRCGRNHRQGPLLWFPWAGTIEAVWAGLWHPTPVLLPGKSQGRGSLVGCRLWGRTESDRKLRRVLAESSDLEIPSLEKTMATHSSTLAWKIPWTEEPGRLQSMRLRRVGHNWALTHMLLYFNGHSKRIEDIRAQLQIFPPSFPC